MHSCPATPGFYRTSHHWLRLAFCVALCIMVAACGFRLKGVSPLPFDTLYTNISENSAFGANMRRAIVASSPHTRFVSEPQGAEARLIQITNRQTRRELSIDAEGQVEEYELNLQFAFQLRDAQDRIVLPTTVLRATREIPYDPDDAQAKQDEIRMLFEDMQQSMVARVVRHLSAPDVADAFEQARRQPAPDTLQETIDSSDMPAPPAGEPFNEWDDTVPGLSVPFD